MANSAQLRRLLKKKHTWTGKQVGQLLIVSMLNDIVALRQGLEPAPFVEQSDFAALEKSLSTDKDIMDYAVYKDLYRGLVDTFNQMQGMQQQYYHGYFLLLFFLQKLDETLKAEDALTGMPYVMTQAQYDRLKKKTREELEGYKDSAADIIFLCLEYFIGQRGDITDEEIEKISPAVMEALNATKKQPPTKNRFKDIYNQFYCNLCVDEQENKEEKEQPSNLEIDARDYMKWRIPEDIMEDEDFVGAYKTYKDFYENQGGKKEHEYQKELPENVTLFDFLDIYIEESRGGLDTDRKEAINHFKKDFPELFAAIVDHVESLIPGFKKIRTTQYHKPLYTWKELDNAGVAAYIGITNPLDWQIIETMKSEGKGDGFERVFHTGIAIAKDPPSFMVDKDGDYKAPAGFKHFFLKITDLEEREEEADNIKAAIHGLMGKALADLYSFNALMEIFGDVYDLPELPQLASFDTKVQEVHIFCYNTLFYKLYHDVKGTDEEREHQREILKNVFVPIDTEKLKPSPVVIEAIRGQLKTLGFTSKARTVLMFFSDFIYKLSNSREGLEQ